MVEKVSVILTRLSEADVATGSAGERNGNGDRCQCSSAGRSLSNGTSWAALKRTF